MSALWELAPPVFLGTLLAMIVMILLTNKQRKLLRGPRRWARWLFAGSCDRRGRWGTGGGCGCGRAGCRGCGHKMGGHKMGGGHGGCMMNAMMMPPKNTTTAAPAPPKKIIHNTMK